MTLAKLQVVVRRIVERVACTESLIVDTCHNQIPGPKYPKCWFPKIGLPPNYYPYFSPVFLKKHPAIGVPPCWETSKWIQMVLGVSSGRSALNSSVATSSCWPKVSGRHDVLIGRRKIHEGSSLASNVFNSTLQYGDFPIIIFENIIIRIILI